MKKQKMTNDVTEALSIYEATKHEEFHTFFTSVDIEEKITTLLATPTTDAILLAISFAVSNDLYEPLLTATMVVRENQYLINDYFWLLISKLDGESPDAESGSTSDQSKLIHLNDDNTVISLGRLFETIYMFDKRAGKYVRKIYSNLKVTPTSLPLINVKAIGSKAYDFAPYEARTLYTELTDLISYAKDINVKSLIADSYYYMYMFLGTVTSRGIRGVGENLPLYLTRSHDFAVEYNCKYLPDKSYWDEPAIESPIQFSDCSYYDDEDEDSERELTAYERLLKERGEL